MDVSTREERIKRIKDAFVTLMWVATRGFSQWLQNFGLTPPQFFALSSLVCHKEPCTMRDLTDVTFQDPPTMTGIIDRLVKMKLVKRTRSEIDRRVVLVEPTPAGIELATKIQEETKQEAIKSYATLTNEELDAMYQSVYYLLRLHVGRYTSLKDEELDAEVDQLLNFEGNPIHFIQLNAKKQIKN